MKNTPEIRATLSRIVAAADNLHTGYQIEVLEYEDFYTLHICQPKDTTDAVYPEIYYKDNWYGTEAVGFEISTTGYGDHSLKQAHRVVAGLTTATTLVENLYTAFEIAGFNTRR